MWGQVQKKYSQQCSVHGMTTLMGGRQLPNCWELIQSELCSIFSKTEYLLSVRQAFASSTNMASSGLRNNIFLRPEEAMFVELAKVCLTEKNYSVLEKTEHSSPWIIISNRMRNLHLLTKTLLVFCRKDLCEARPKTPSVFIFSDVLFAFKLIGPPS